MNTGDTVKFKFGNQKEEKEGVIIKMFSKTVYIKADFPNHKGKIIKRKRHQITS